jgi:hypothetical protein
MLEVWFTCITLQEFFNVLFVVILKMPLNEVSFTMAPASVESQNTMSKTLTLQNAIILECIKQGEKRNANMVFVGKSEEKSPLRRPRHRWENHIKVDLE